MRQTSFWESPSTSFDIVIIGGGFLGSWTAYELSKERKLSIAVIESSTLSRGASTNNAGFACFGSASELLSDINFLGEKKSLEITNKRLNGIKKIRSVLGDSAISFDNCGGYEIFFDYDTVPSEDTIQQLNELLQSSLSIHPFRFLSTNEILSQGFSNNVKTAIANPHEGSIHPVKALEALHSLAKYNGVQFFFNTTFQAYNAINSRISVISAGVEDTIITKKVIHCTNAFSHYGDIVPGRGQVLLTSVIESLPFRGTFHYDEGYVYFRNVDSKEGRRILLGGGRNKDFSTEESTAFESNPTIMNYLQDFLSSILPTSTDFSIEKTWTGIMGFSKDKLPIVQQLNNNEFLGFACNGMGVALTPIISEEIAALVKSTI